MKSTELAIIEDEEPHFQLMKRAIEKECPGTFVRHFEEGNHFLVQLDNFRPDLIVTDYLIAGMNGLELITALKERALDIPVIMITGQGSEDVAVQAMKLGATDYLVKSQGFFNLLPRIITKVIEERAIRDSLRLTERRFTEIFYQSPIGIQLYDQNGTLLEANKSCLDIFEVSDIEDMRDLELFRVLNIAQVVESNLRRGDSVRFETEFDSEKVKPNRSYHTTQSGKVYLDVAIAPMPMPAEDRGEIFQYIVQVQDISKRRRAEQRVHDLSQQLIKAQEAERYRLSCNLHDNLAQDLSSLKFGLDTLLNGEEKVAQEIQLKTGNLSKLLEGVISVVGEMAYDLRPTGLNELGLSRTISRYCDEFSVKNGIHVDFFPAGIRDLSLDFDTSITIYRLIQEALTNIKKHAHADRVIIRLTASFPIIILHIEDNGKGFDVGTRTIDAAREKRMGLRIMAERVAALQGEMKIDSLPKQGTKVVIKFPWNENVQ